MAVERDKPFITRRGVVWFVVSCVATAALWGLFALGLAATSGSGGGVSQTTADSLCAPLGNTGVLNWGGSRGTAILTVRDVRLNQANTPGLRRFLKGVSDSTWVVECDFGDLGRRTCDGKARFLLTVDGERKFTYPCGYRTPFGQ